MSDIWMAIAPGIRDTRVIAMAGASETILKARLSLQPSHARAMSTLLEAVALWQGTKVRAALCADERAGVSDSSLFHEAFTDFGGPLYSVDWVPAAGRVRRQHRDIDGVGHFADLRRILITEVAR
jgi:hypothetical protein